MCLARVKRKPGKINLSMPVDSTGPPVESQTDSGTNLRNLDRRTVINIGSDQIEIEPDNLDVVCQLGRGAYGIVERVKHRPTGHEMAVKVIRISVYVL